MKKIGKEVCFLQTGPTNSRNGEGDFIRLPDGRIMFAYTEYVSGKGDDHAPARISAVFSSDEGESFTGHTVLFETDGGDVNNMCVSLLEMGRGDIGLFYGRKFVGKNGNISMDVMLRRSRDGISWSEPKSCIGRDEYFVYENDRVVRLQSGRILIPLNLHESRGEDVEGEGVTHYFYSDDDGESFTDSGARISHPSGEKEAGLQETGVLQFSDGTLFSYSRTLCGSQFESFSRDEGITWSTPHASTVFFSPNSPMQTAHLKNGKTVAIFNPIPNYPGRDTVNEPSGRTPFMCLVTDGDGSGFWTDSTPYLLEDDMKNGYCYASVFAADDYFLVSYYHSENNPSICLKACKIVKIMYSETE